MFRPIWVVLYSLMTISALLMWKRPAPLHGIAHRRVPMFFFGLQVKCLLTRGTDNEASVVNQAKAYFYLNLLLRADCC